MHSLQLIIFLATFGSLKSQFVDRRYVIYGNQPYQTIRCPSVIVKSTEAPFEPSLQQCLRLSTEHYYLTEDHFSPEYLVTRGWHYSQLTNFPHQNFHAEAYGWILIRRKKKDDYLPELRIKCYCDAKMPDRFHWNYIVRFTDGNLFPQCKSSGFSTERPADNMQIQQLNINKFGTPFIVEATCDIVIAAVNTEKSQPYNELEARRTYGYLNMSTIIVNHNGRPIHSSDYPGIPRQGVAISVFRQESQTKIHFDFEINEWDISNENVMGLLGYYSVIWSSKLEYATIFEFKVNWYQPEPD